MSNVGPNRSLYPTTNTRKPHASCIESPLFRLRKDAKPGSEDRSQRAGPFCGARIACSPSLSPQENSHSPTKASDKEEQERGILW